MLIVGLGNPGSQYSNTKHNFGYWVINSIINNKNLSFKSGYGEYVYSKDGEVIFSKPTTNMNNSGLAIKGLCHHYNDENLLIVYDDIDLPLGMIRFRADGGSGGHKGIESIIYQLRTENFPRLKLGIAIKEISMRPSEKYVLKPFPRKYEPLIHETLDLAVDAIEFFMGHGIENAMNKFN